jgi:hypothetical protein
MRRHVSITAVLRPEFAICFNPKRIEVKNARVVYNASENISYITSRGYCNLKLSMYNGRIDDGELHDKDHTQQAMKLSTKDTRSARINMSFHFQFYMQDILSSP